MVALTLLLLSCTALFLLPLAPAILEWLRPTDAAPLNVVREYGGNIGHFAASFHHFVNAQLRPLLDRAASEHALVKETLPDGSRVIALPGGSGLREVSQSANVRETSHLILAAGDLSLDGEHIFSGEIYADGNLRSGPGLVLRAVLAKGDIHLGSEAYVLRWLHADGAVVTGENSRLYGRTSAGQRLVLGQGSRFARMYAPRIEFAPANRPAPVVLSQPLHRRMAFERPEQLHLCDKERWLMRGQLSVTANTWHRGHLIASEDLCIGAGTFVCGSVKGQNVTLALGSRVHGSVVAGARVIMESDSQAMGPIVAEDMVVIASGCVVGSLDHPTTITAPRIRIAPGALVHGSIWAREEGEVLV